jgi:two-component system alkaline phosphatase synthesis response regulator PhoP
MATRRERVLVIEDEADILELMLYNLQREGYLVNGTQHGDEGLRRARAEKPDLVLLDLMLPGLSGIEVCRRLKADPETKELGIIMVTAKSEADDVCAGLEVGADDYIPKPFSPKVLLARVKAVLRRRRGEDDGEDESSDRIEVPGLVVDPERHEVKVEGTSITFTATEFRLLHFLASNPGRVFTRNHLLSRVVGEDSFVIDRNVDVHIGAVRKKLGPLRDRIETVRGVGYRFKDQ